MVKEEDFMTSAVFIGSEEETFVDPVITEEDVTMEHPPHQQDCDLCNAGIQMLMRNSEDQTLMWNCDNPQCLIHQPDVNCILLPAQGVLLCPRCNAAEMMPIQIGENANETELQCMNHHCNQTVLMFELSLVYARMGRFRVDRLG